MRYRYHYTKKVWPGVWTHSVYGHPTPGEAIDDAVLRRAKHEPGLKHLGDLRCVAPKYICKTPLYNGVIEHEYCPIVAACISDEPKPNAEEVEAYKWAEWPVHKHTIQAGPEKISYWRKDQYPTLKKLAPFVSLQLDATSRTAYAYTDA